MMEAIAGTHGNTSSTDLSSSFTCTRTIGDGLTATIIGGENMLAAGTGAKASGSTSSKTKRSRQILAASHFVP
jgi:hypothetical protein